MFFVFKVYYIILVFLFKFGFDVNVRDNDGIILFYYVVMYCENKECVVFLCVVGVSVRN